MSETYNGWVPLPPSVNEAYITSPKTGRRFDSPKKKEWTATANRVLTTTIQRRKKLRNPKRKGLRDNNRWTVRLTVCLSTWRRDIDNCAKPIIDVVADRLRLDDRYVVHVEIIRGAVMKETEGVAIHVEVSD